MKTKKQTFKELNQKEVISINGGSVRIVTIFINGVPVIKTIIE
ncbi:MAG: hypothetical protein PARBA_01525 [Parabacteroides sp.]